MTPAGPVDRYAPTARGGSGAADLGARVIELADLEWCRSRLRSTTRGLLSTGGPRRPVSLDVGCATHGDQVVITLAPDHEALHLLVGREVTLGLTGYTDDGVRWVVRLTGVADLAGEPPSSADLTMSGQRHPAYGLGSALGDTLLLPVHRLRGYHETALDEVAEAPVHP